MDNLSIKLTQLKLLLPEIFCEEQIDFQKFQQLFSEHITSDSERYMLNWAGKSEAYRILQAQTCKTLTPQPAESVNFDSTENIFIEGENLDVLKVLQKSYFNSIKMIYIDPPYNTGNDFVYNDNFKQDLKDYQEQSGELDEEGKLKLAFKKNSKENGHFHSKWLNMMLPRLHLAKNLLKDDGVIFISIDDNEQAQLKLLCDEVFGEENFVAEFTLASNSAKNNSKFVSITHEYLVCYAKNKQQTLNDWKVPKNNLNEFKKIAENLFKKGLTNDEVHNELLSLVKYPKYYEFDHYTYIDEKGLYQASDLTAPNSTNRYDIIHPTTGNVCKSGTRGWAYSKTEIEKLIQEGYILFGDDEKTMPRLKNYLFENEKSLPRSVLFFDSQSSTKWIKQEKLNFDFPKAIDYIKYIVSMYPEKNLTVLDFFSGSGTTAHAVMQLNAEDNGNRRFICVQLPEVMDEKSEAFKAGFKNIAEISKERIRRAGKQIAENHPDKQLDIGFKVFKLTDSHFKQWQSPSAENLAQQIELFVDPVRKEATPNAMLYEILLRLGLKLTAKVRSENQVFWVSDESGQQFALLLETLSADLLDQVISAQPKKVVMLDSLFNGDDALKKNAELQMNDAGIAFFVL
ncbi:site-specific DNA-methyltransferase [Aggregatibacter kilianii]|uniref:site-specific DNA-methyltransferase n=1 Tax=Aggregatibacter kilianii TaxID=2025884 RepID=UPI000D653217